MTADPSAAARQKDRRGPLRVLILEDAPDDAVLLLAHLRREAYDITSRVVADREGFAKALDECAWDVILADYSLPQFNALDALDVLRRSGCDIPFIVVSGSVGEAAAASVMKAGAHDFFLKGQLARLAVAIDRERTEASMREEHRQALVELRRSEERLREAVQARDDFLTIASHELKTPLSSLCLQVDSARHLLDRGGPADVDVLRSQFNRVSRQVWKLNALINNLLEVTRIASGRLPLSAEEFDLRETIDNVRAGMADAIARSGSALQVRTGGDLVGRWDRMRIESVVSNLLLNAVKFGMGNAIEVELVGDETSVRMTIIDHGTGIGLAEQERLFNRFERAVPEHHFGGFGLGLWLSREIVEAHGGSIQVASSPGEGSRFTVVLPRRVESPS